MITLTLYDGDVALIDTDDGEIRLIPDDRLDDFRSWIGCMVVSANIREFREHLWEHVGDHIEVLLSQFTSLPGTGIYDRALILSDRYEDEDEDPFVEEDTYVEPVQITPREDEALIPEHEGRCHCPTCKMARFEDSPLAAAVIQDYSYNPGWEAHAVPGESPDYYLGVELETDNYRRAKFTSGNVASDFPIHVAAGMRLPFEFWVPKYDSSVTGPEFASHPGSMAFWQSIRPEVEQMFTMLLHAGYRSHDNDSCGMHVNIGREAFEDSKHLFRFLTLIHTDTNWSLAMSQRTARSAREWANSNGAATAPEREDLAAQYWDGQEYSHSAALNCPEEDHGSRFEFRLPRGTLRVDRFYKNLEWTVGMIEFTRDTRLSNVTPATFMAWARGNRDTYPDLVAYLDEKFPVAVAA